jgi:fructose/tagatose bisphosphate aldolase
MPLVRFHELMADAERGGYAAGYFESWNLESLLAVADAAEAVRSPVILGFSGLYLTHPARRVRDPLGVYAAMAREVGRNLSVPCCLLFNESPDLDSVLAAIDLGFGLVMYSDDGLGEAELGERVRRVVGRAHAAGSAVEGEMAPLEGMAGDLGEDAAVRAPTDPRAAQAFVERTGVDSLAVNVGQVHLHGRCTVRLDLGRLREIREQVQVPLALHGASSVDREDLKAAVRLGVRKVNVGSVLKQASFQALGAACADGRHNPNPYEVIGSGLAADVLVAGRLAMQAVVEEWMHCLGSAGTAGG